MNYSLHYGIYTIKRYDTIQKIAAKLNPPVDWKNLVNINNLEYPYIVPPDFQREGYAQGTIGVKRKDGVAGNIFIPKNTTVIGVNNNTELTFHTQSDISVPDIGSVVVTVNAAGYGRTYNLPAHTPLRFAEDSLNRLVVATNPEPFTGGFFYQVRKWGETIYVPLTQDGNTTPAIDLIRAYGVDFGTEEKQVSLGSNSDLALVAGVSNLVQALNRVVTTQKGSYLPHPFYGSNLHHYIGEPLSEELFNILEVELKEALLQDVRVKSVDNVSVSVFKDQITIDCKVITRTDLVFPLQVVIDPMPKGGGLRGNLQA